MQVSVKYDASALNRKIENWQKKLAYAVSDGINETAKLVQRVERENVQSKFTVRKNEFINRQAAIIKPFASPKKGYTYAEVSVGQRPRLLLSTMEKGGVKKPFIGKSVAVPITGGQARPGFSSSVNNRLTFKAMNMKAHTTSGGKKQWKGQNRTFVISNVGVFQRNGSSKGDISLLYKFVDDPVLKAQLQFIATANRVASQWLNRNIEAQLKRKGLL